MKGSYMLIGLIIFLGPILFIRNDLVNLKIQTEGRSVLMEIVDKPNFCVGTRAKWMMKVKYGDLIFSKQISSSYCESHSIGDAVEVKYLEGYDEIVLPDENITFKFISSAVLMIFGIYVIYLSFKSK